MITFYIYRDFLLFADVSIQISAVPCTFSATDFKHVLLICFDIFSSMFLILDIIIHQSILYEFLSNLIGSLLLYYDFILHWFTFYGAFKLLILHGFTFFGGFDLFVSSSWPTAVLQVDASQLTLLAVCCNWWIQIKKFVHTNSGRNSAEVSTTYELICLRLQASLIFIVFPRSASVGAC